MHLVKIYREKTAKGADSAPPRIDRVKLISFVKLCWFQSYISKMKQSCKVNRKLCNLREVTCEVLKGSSLVHLLFIVYVNDLPLSIKYSQVNVYTSDASLSFYSSGISKINEKINEYLERLACRK